MHGNRISRHAYNLMSMASIAVFAIVCTWAFGVMQLLMAADHRPVHNVITMFGARIDDVAALVHEDGGHPWRMLPALIAATWPWASLRRLGAALYRHPAVSNAVARRLQGLGYALTGSAVLIVVVTPAISGLLSHGKVVSVGLSTTFFIQVVAASCAFTMALIMREAIRLAEENQSFV
jgi:hypothetical protein